VKSIRKWWLRRRLGGIFGGIWWAIQRERLGLMLAQANLTPGKTIDGAEDKIKALIAAEHICPTCRYFDGTCLFGLDANVDKVIKCAEFNRRDQ
tara:strand:- start:905 stop:1186 length:282 start_codon:yes stop_codon:yes gene_type:complete